MILLEVCCADIESVIAAIDGGAQRIELCSALEAGGLTPSHGLIAVASALCRNAGVKLHTLLRPRPGDYLYSTMECSVIMRDIMECHNMGVDGVVIGALRPDGAIDNTITQMLSDEAHSLRLSVTFHRAFDLCRDPFEALDALATMGTIDRVLTSGQASSAPEGASLIASLVERAGDRLTILAGAGINSSNAAALVMATGVKELHASAKKTIGSDMIFRRGDVAMGRCDNDEYSRQVTDADEVALILSNLQKMTW
ncbi:MAG: copper homeostasis protein CutC [Pseudoflavonifractor sp.]|nr:copper homeostasis protein CutC [Alloprevotella sp.]MCM1116491.1 copper homeostasis protein CutC [Pseudoflavonifractor sp.]